MRKIMFSAGEVSADVHGANLARKLLEVDSNLYLFGLGGERMKRAGVDIRYDIRPMSTVGAIEYLRYYPALRWMGSKIVGMMEREKPDALVLIDTQGFNVALSKLARRRGIRTVYYFPPQAWHIRPYTFGGKVVKDVMDNVTEVISVFPGEYEAYKKYGDNVAYVGNPVIEVVKPTKDRRRTCADLGLSESSKVIGLFPGSRRQEVEKLLPVLLSVALRLHLQDSGMQFVVSIAADFLEGYIIDRVKGLDFIKPTREPSYNLMSICDVIIACSGTITLEASAIGVPMVVVYKTSLITWNLAKRFLNLTYISHPNMIAGAAIVPELLQKNASPENIARDVRDLLEPSRNKRVRCDLAEVREKLGGGEALDRAAKIVLKVAGCSY